MKQKKVISLPTNSSKIYRQILAFMNFLLKISEQERDVLAEILKLDKEYEALPQEKRAKFILSTDMRKEMRETLGIEEKQFNVVISRLRTKMLFGKPLIGEQNELHPELQFSPDEDGFRIEVNLVMTEIPKQTATTTTTVEPQVVPQQEEQSVVVPATQEVPGLSKFSDPFFEESEEFSLSGPNE